MALYKLTKAFVRKARFKAPGRKPNNIFLKTTHIPNRHFASSLFCIKQWDVVLTGTCTHTHMDDYLAYFRKM